LKNYLIIGASSGIGKALAENLSAENKVFGTYNNTFRETEENISFHKVNVQDENIDLSFLPDILHGIVYCPGSINLKPFHRLTEEDFMNDWQINFMGAVKMIQHLLPNLKRADQPSIVLFSTVAVKTGMPFHASIASAKGAIEGLTTSLAAELAPKIRVNCLAPSLTQTGLADKLINTPEKLEAGNKRHPLQRIGQTADIAELACFLLSGKSGWITGQVMHVDGGMSTLKV